MDDTSYSTPTGSGSPQGPAQGPPQQPGTPEPGAPWPGPGARQARPRLTRSRRDRKVAGVCGGLAAHLGIDPLILRVVVVVLTLFGGSGLLLYVAGWLLLPDEGQQHSEIDRIIGRDRSRGPSVGAVLVTVVLLLVLAGSLGLGAAFGGSWWGGPDLWPLVVVGGIIALIWYVRRDNPPPGLGTRPATNPQYVPPGPYATPAQYTPPAQYAPQPPYAAQQPYGSGTAAAALSGAGAPTLVDVPVGAPSAVGPPPGWGASPGGPFWPPVPPRPVRERSVLGGVTWWLALVAAGVMLLGDRTHTWHLHPVTFFAVLLAVAGVGLVVGAFVGRSRGLIVLGVALTMVTALVSAVPAVGAGRTGTVSWAPTSISAVPAGGFSLAAGNATLDLSGTALDAGSNREVQVQVGAGKLFVLIPPDVGLVLHADVGLGSILTPDGQRQDGVGRTVDAQYGPATTPARGTLTLRLDVGAGQLEVRYAQA